MFLLLMVIAILPSSYAYVDCKTACRHCRENREHATLLEVHCAMCRECKLRRKGMQQPQVSQSTTFRPLLPRQRARTGPKPSHATRMQNQEQVEHVALAHDEYSDYPEGCPTPPECKSEEELETLKMSNTTTTIPTTTTTCPPIPMCKQKRKRHTQAPAPHCAQPVCAPTTCTPCMPMCALPCVQSQPPVTEFHSLESLKLTYTAQPPTQVVYVPAPTEVKTQVLFQQSVNQLLIQQSALQAMQASHQATQSANQGQQQLLLQEAANQALQAANQGQQQMQLQQSTNQVMQSTNENQQQLLLQQAASQVEKSLNQAMQSNQGQNQVVFQQPGRNQVLNNQVTVPQMIQPALPSAGTTPDYYYLYLGVPNNMMNKDC